MNSNDEVHVVIDVMMFSSSVIAVLDSGVSSIIPVHPNENILEYSDYITGSETEKSDFRNSPQNIYSTFGVMDTVPDTVAFTSSNGAKRVVELIRDNSVDSESIVIGSLMNAKSVSDILRDVSSFTIHTAGSNGSVALEDEISKELIKRETEKKPINYTNVSELVSELPIERIFDKDTYEWITDEDLHHVTNINSTSIVPSVNKNNHISVL